MSGLIGLTEQLLRIDSPTGSERAIGDFLETQLRALAPHALVRAGNSLCGAPRARDPKLPTVLLLGHTDTVPKLSDNPVRREGDRLFGLGASDMKAALAVMIGLCERAARVPPRTNLACVFYAGEEGPFAGSELPAIRDAAREWFDGAQLAICMEPTDGHIELGCLGTLHARVTFTGRRAHSARPWQGENAIHKAAGLLSRLAARAPRDVRFGDLVYREVMSATMVEHRGARNVVPDRFVVNVNHRFAPGKDEAATRADIAELVAGEAEFAIDDWCPAAAPCTANPLLAELRAAAGAELRSKQAWTDVGRLAQWGVPAANYGPGATAQAHQAGEWVSVAAIERAERALARWLCG